MNLDRLYDEEQKTTECACGHKADNHMNPEVRCRCCVEVSKDTDSRGKRPLVVFRYIKGRAGHFSGSVHVS